VRHGIALHRQETLQALHDVDGSGLADLLAESTVLEVPLGSGRRYVPAEAVPAAVLAAAVLAQAAAALTVSTSWS
jgi:hypothetical protein